MISSTDLCDVVWHQLIAGNGQNPRDVHGLQTPGHLLRLYYNCWIIRIQVRRIMLVALRVVFI